MKYLMLIILCGSTVAAEDWTKATTFCTDKDNENRKTLSIDVSEIKALKLSAEKEHEAIAKKFKEELKRFEKAKPVPKKDEKPADVVPIPDNSVDSGKGRLIRTFYVYPEGYNTKT